MPLPKPFQGVLFDYEVVTQTGVLPHNDGDPVTQETIAAPDGKVILGVNAYYYDDGSGDPLSSATTYQNITPVMLVSDDGHSVTVISAASASAHFPVSAVVQLICARINA